MERIADRIKLLRTRHELTQAALAKKIGVTSVTVSKWELDVANPKSESMIRLCKVFDISIEWLNNGGGECRNNDYNNLIHIPYYSELSLSSGEGFNLPPEHSNENIVISKHFLKTEFENLVCLKVEGNSMEPRFKDQSLVFVDLNDKKVVDGSVYIVNHDHMIRMKVLEVTPSGFFLKSLNKDYLTVSVDLKETPFFIVGKVKMQLSFH